VVLAVAVEPAPVLGEGPLVIVFEALRRKRNLFVRALRPPRAELDELSDAPRAGALSFLADKALALRVDYGVYDGHVTLIYGL